MKLKLLLIATAAFLLVWAIAQRRNWQTPTDGPSPITGGGPSIPVGLDSFGELSTREPVDDVVAKLLPDAPGRPSDLLIRVVADRTGRPVGGAFLSGDDGTRAESGQDGIVVLARPPGGMIWTEFKVEKEEFASRTILVDWRDRELLVRLSEPGSIRGVVRLESGAPPSSTVDVVGWPVSGGHPTLEEFRSALRGEGNGSIVHVKTDLAGAFEIADASPNEMYLVVAGRGGYVTRQYQRALVGGEALDLLLTRVYALRVRLISSSGAQISLDDPWIARRAVSWWSDSEFSGPMDISQAVLALGGIPDKYRDDGDAIVKAFYSRQEVPEIDCALDFECPGFAPARLIGLARPIDLGGPSTTFRSSRRPRGSEAYP